MKVAAVPINATLFGLSIRKVKVLVPPTGIKSSAKTLLSVGWRKVRQPVITT